jgi:hypothetical protein
MAKDVPQPQDPCIFGFLITNELLNSFFSKSIITPSTYG